ncbi:hypothetical protein BaRGS_00021059, partial [Batillaria attramentaria]
ADFLNLTFGLLPTWYGWQYGIWFVDESKAACLFLKYVGYSLGMLSTLLLMLLTAHRALATVFPRRVDGCSKRQALLSIFLAAASVFIVNSYVLVFMDLVDNRCRWERQFYKNYAEVVNWVNAVLYSGLPFVVIACSNFVIAKAVRSSKLKQTPTPKDDAHACHRPVHAKVTFIITSVSMAFLILTLPSSVVRLVNGVHVYSAVSPRFIVIVIQSDVFEPTSSSNIESPTLRRPAVPCQWPRVWWNVYISTFILYGRRPTDEGRM